MTQQILPDMGRRTAGTAVEGVFHQARPLIGSIWPVSPSTTLWVVPLPVPGRIGL